MAQLSLYFTDATMQRLRADAKASNTSISKYVSSLVTNAKAQEGWPAGYWDTVYGALDDPTFVVPFRTWTPAWTVQSRRSSRGIGLPCISSIPTYASKYFGEGCRKPMRL